MADITLPPWLADKPDDTYIVLETMYPTSYGCNRGRVWTAVELARDSVHTPSKETFSDYDDAVKAAQKARNDCDHFEFCGRDSDDSAAGEGADEEDLPPYDSADAQNWDKDEEVRIQVVTIKEFRKSEQKEWETIARAYFNHMLKQKMAVPKAGKGAAGGRVGKPAKRTALETKLAKKAALEELT